MLSIETDIPTERRELTSAYLQYTNFQIFALKPKAICLLVLCLTMFAFIKKKVVYLTKIEMMQWTNPFYTL
jgi:hypothetical protein